MAPFFLFWVVAAGALAGTVREDPSRTPVPYATVELVELGRSATSDADGYYVFAGLPAGEWTVRASALGYIEQQRAVQIPEDGAARVDFMLRRNPVDVEGLRVQIQRPGEAVGVPPVRIDLATVKRTPAYAEPDILRAAQMTPAAQPISDFSSALYLRGGAPDQTLVTLDGVPLFNPYHAGGVLSAFTPEAVESVEVLPGGLGAGMGDRLSGAVAIRTRDAERDRFHFDGGLGLLSARGTVSGPLPLDGGLVVSGRHSFAPLGGAIYAKGMIPKDLDHSFRDGLVRVSRDVGPAGSLTLTAYADREGFRAAQSFRHIIDYDWRWGTRLAGLRFRYPVTPSLQVELRAGLSHFGTDLESAWKDGLEQDETLDGSGRMRDALVAGDAVWHGRFHTLRFGGQVDDYRFRYDVIHGSELATGSVETYVPGFRRTDELTTVVGYVEEELRPHRAVTARAGARFLDAGALGQKWLPRLGLRLDLGRGLVVSGSAGEYAQAVHSLRAVESTLSSLMAYEVYAVQPPDMGLATAQEVTGGLSWSIGNLSVRMDAYLREMESLPLPPLPPDPLTGPIVVPDGYAAGTGRARGVEALFRYVRGDGGAWVSYALQESRRTQDGVEYAPRFDRRHFLDGMVVVPLGSRTTASARALFGTGQPFTPLVGVLPPSVFDPETDRLRDNSHAVGLLGAHNAGRLDPYFRTDLGVRHETTTEIFGKEVVLRPYLQVLNVTLADNELTRARPQGLLPPCTAEEQLAIEGGVVLGVLSCTQQTTDQFPLMVSVGIEWQY